jgi:hypothetical protein
MKPLWIAALVVSLLCCGGIAFMGVRLFGAAKDVVEEALAYGDESVLAVASQWSESELKSRMAPEVFEQNPEGAIENAARVLSGSLGPIRKETLASSIQGIEAKADSDDGNFVLAKYRATADFEKAKGEIEMELIKRGSQWRILKFNGKPIR